MSKKQKMKQGTVKKLEPRAHVWPNSPAALDDDHFEVDIVEAVPDPAPAAPPLPTKHAAKLQADEDARAVVYDEGRRAERGAVNPYKDHLAPSWDAGHADAHAGTLSAYNAGAEAGLDDKPHTANPHPAGSPEAKAWHDGWLKEGVGRPEAPKRPAAPVEVDQDPLAQPSGKFTESQLEALRHQFARIAAVNPNSPAYKRLTGFLDQMEREKLIQLSGAKIKWISMLARNTIFTR